MKASAKQAVPDHLELEGVSLETIQNALDPSKEIKSIDGTAEE